MSNIAANLNDVRQRIIDACTACGRQPDAVQLLAVSKTKPASQVQQAIDAGQQHFGENYLQDALDKVSLFPNACWHFIGHIQSNKTRQIANNFDWVHSVSSLKVARRLNEQRTLSEPLNIMLQVNISDDAAKDGLRSNEVASVVKALQGMSKIRLRGLMTITVQSDDVTVQRHHFNKLATLLQELQAGSETTRDFDQLSMGMTGDLEAAIAEGATWVRIGTAIFGAR